MSQVSIDLGVMAGVIGQAQGGEQLVPAGGGGTTAVPTTGAPGTATPAGTGTTGTGGLGSWIFLPLILVFGFMIWTSSRQQKKEQAKRQEMLKGLHRGDKVQTIGGVIGTVADIADDDVVLTVEQGRIRFAKSAIQQVVRASGTKSEPVLEAKPEGSAAKV
jgi:preprotein translocase subunit YajC